mgnify:CR=1 FL=1
MSKKVKTYITLPADILQTIDRLAGKRGRSKFMTEAAEEKIAKEISWSLERRKSS